MKTQKLAVIGAGHVGSHVLAYAAKSELFGEIAVVDPRGKIAFGEALDQDHATGLISRRNINIHSGHTRIPFVEFVGVAVGLGVAFVETNSTPRCLASFSMFSLEYSANTCFFSRWQRMQYSV